MRDAFVIDRHHDRREARADIFVGEIYPCRYGHRRSTSACRRWMGRAGAGRIDSVEDGVRQFRFGIPPPSSSRAGVNSQPPVQEITLPDRFHHRSFGALKLQGSNPRPQRDMNQSGEIFYEACAGWLKWLSGQGGLAAVLRGQVRKFGCNG